MSSAHLEQELAALRDVQQEIDKEYNTSAAKRAATKSQIKQLERDIYIERMKQSTDRKEIAEFLADPQNHQYICDLKCMPTFKDIRETKIYGEDRNYGYYILWHIILRNRAIGTQQLVRLLNAYSVAEVIQLFSYPEIKPYYDMVPRVVNLQMLQYFIDARGMSLENAVNCLGCATKDMVEYIYAKMQPRNVVEIKLHSTTLAYPRRDDD